MARRPQQPIDRAGADHGQVVRRARPQAHAQLLDLELAHPRHELVAVAQQLVHRTGGGLQVEPALFDRRAEHVAAVRARHEIAALEADRAVHEARPRRIAQPQDLSLDRAHGRGGVARKAAHIDAAGTGGDHHRGREHALASLQLHATHRGAAGEHAPHAGVLA